MSATSSYSHFQQSKILLERLFGRLFEENSAETSNIKTYGAIEKNNANPVSASHNEISLKGIEDHNKMSEDAQVGGDFYIEKGRLVRKRGLHWVIAALFIVADMAGGGIVALPTAIVRCSFTLGIVLLLLMAVLATSSSVFLGKAWVILLRQFPIYRTHCRKPYAEMGFRAFGPKMKFFVSLCLNITQFGASTVFLLLIAKNSNDFLRAVFQKNFGMCFMIVIVALFIFPITLLKSPQDFWPVVVLGMASTGVAVILVCIGAVFDHRCFYEHKMPNLQLTNVFVALGTIMFTYGGHSALPTIQHDMRKPSQFAQSSILAFSLITIMNLIAVLFGALTYGDSLRESVINSIQTIWIQQAINVMILAHCLLTFTLIINPLNQEAEEYFNVPQGFTIKRVVVRIAMMTATGFMAATVPTFDSILSLIGALAFMLISMIFPCIFYMYLSAAEKYNAEIASKLANSNQLIHNKSTSLAPEYCRVQFSEVLKRTRPEVLLICGVVCIVGSVAGAIATIMAIISIFLSNFEIPCYIKPFSSNPSDVAATICCGAFQNISIFNNQCQKTVTNFYNSSIF